MCVPDGKPPHKAIVSWAELEKHNSPTDLWVAIEGKAYDVTAWRLVHPGGWRLLEVRGVLTRAYRRELEIHVCVAMI